LIAGGQLSLKVYRAVHRIDDALKLDQQPITSRFENPAPTLGDFPVE
jgi:hypothetical protein